MNKTKRKYTTEFKEQAIGLMSLGKPVAEVARDLEVSANLLYNWRQQGQSAQGGSVGQQAEGELSEADTLRALRRENARLQAENEILKKAAIILGTKTPNNSVR
jgi:transposase